MFAYTCHFNTFAICNELQNNSMERINRTIVLTVTVVFTIYCLVGYFGYYTYGTNAEDNIITNYPQNVAVSIVRIGLSFAIAFSYPVLLHPCRNCLGSLVFDEPNCAKLSAKRFWILTAAIVVLSFTISIFADNLNDILGIVGSTGISVIAFILPGLFYFYMDGLEKMDGKWYKFKRNLGIVFVILGIILIPFCIFFQFYEID